LNVVPLPKVLSASMLPPMASSWVFTKNSPIPLPFTDLHHMYLPKVRLRGVGILK
jgi:hypothetical protein